MVKLTTVIFIISIIYLSLTIKTEATFDTFSNSSHTFAINFYQKSILKNDTYNSNFIFSPLSIEMIISLLYMGSNGKTKEEIDNVFNYNCSNSDSCRSMIGNNYENLLNSFNNNNNNNPLFTLANKMYTMKNIKINKNFSNIAKQQFRTEIESIDFGDSEKAIAQINKWIGELANYKIDNVIEQIENNVKMIILNVIHFKGIWDMPFTIFGKLPFHNDDGTSVDVDMMYVEKTVKFGLFNDLRMETIELQFKNSDITMLILLPYKFIGLAKFIETKLHTINFDELYAEMIEYRIEIYLPKFQIESKIDLSDVLKKLGLTTMFNSNADFSDLFESDEDVSVSSAVQKASIKIDEYGAVVEAASAIDLVPISVPPTFKADHPFLYIIKQKDRILFMGHVTSF